MIFVTVGTHEQPFNRLIREIDRIKAQGLTGLKSIFETDF
ncbi:multidrug MFS transporter, partial [Lacticaseibacillus paracasei]